MPVTPTYPGVYIEEIPSGVRTITGVATSITAFVGRTLRGPINEPTLINNFTDFERRFGNLDVDYPMGYAVRDFYLNGGSQALILRLFGKPKPGENKDPKGVAKYTGEVLQLQAGSPGEWGNKLFIRIDHTGLKDGDPQAQEAARRYDLRVNDLFNLAVLEILTDGRRIVLETFPNVSLNPAAGSRRLDRILENQSVLIRCQAEPNSPNRPDEILDNFPRLQGGADSDYLEQPDFELQLQDPADPTSAKIPKTGLEALEKADLFNLLCIPPEVRTEDTQPEIYQLALKLCVKRRAMLIVDPPYSWGTSAEAAADRAKSGLSALGLVGTDARNAVLYFPRVIQADPLREGQTDTFVPCGIIAGIMAKTDVQRGVWKAPAGIDAGILGIQGLQVNLSNDENGVLNPLGINCLRYFPPVYGRVVWGARTLRGADQLADEYKYLPVRRTLLFLEESLYRGTQWVVFEPNDEPLWAQIRLNIGAFMNGLFRQGAFQGKTPKEAYFVKCDSETTTQYDIDRGIVNIIVGFAPLKPAEFVILKFQQMTKQAEV